MRTIDLLESQAVTMHRANLLFANKQRSLASCFKNYPVLAHVSQEGIAALAEKARTLSYPKNGVIISEGSAGNALYIVISGKVRIYTCDSDNPQKQITLKVQGPGSYFGEISLLTGEPRPVSVKTLEPTVCAVVSKENFIAWLEQYPSAAVAFLTSISEKLTYLTEKFRQMAFKDVYKRIVLTLKEIGINDGTTTIIHEFPTQQELALMVGASREMVGKIMNELVKGGYVQRLPDRTLIITKKFPASW